MARTMAGLLVLAGLATAAQAQWTGEFLLPAAGAGVVLGWIAPAPAEMREYVPRGETVDRWSRMVTVQRFPARPGLTPQALLTRLGAGMQAACPGADVSSVESEDLGTHAAARVRVRCPLNAETAKPETMFARAVLGDEAMQLIQAATRRVATADDERWAAAVLGGATLCGAAGEPARCDAARRAAVGSAP